MPKGANSHASSDYPDGRLPNLETAIGREKMFPSGIEQGFNTRRCRFLFSRKQKQKKYPHRGLNMVQYLLVPLFMFAYRKRKNTPTGNWTLVQYPPVSFFIFAARRFWISCVKNWWNSKGYCLRILDLLRRELTESQRVLPLDFPWRTHLL